MTPEGAYGAFAWAYDAALGRRYFEESHGLVDRLVAAYRSDLDQPHLDLGCGTGIFLEHATRLGMQSVGLDLSLQMLSIARRRSERVVAGDFRSLPFRGSFGVVTSLYDSLNHVLDESDLARTFAEVGRLLSRRGIFVFDLNHPDSYVDVWGAADPWRSKGRSHHLMMETEFDEESALGVATVSGWALVEGRKVSFEERHRQRAWTVGETEELLRRSGLSMVATVPFDPFEEIRAAQPVKLVFVARRSD